MALMVLHCGQDKAGRNDTGTTITEDSVTEILHRRNIREKRVSHHYLDAVPSRRELRFLDEMAAEILPEDPTPSLDEISAQPDVEHLGTPKHAPQQPAERLRVIVIGSDASLGAVLTRMMRADYLWAEVGYVPGEESSAAAVNWAIPTDPEAALEIAVAASVHPAPLIRTDTGLAVAGSATISNWDNHEFTGEIIVDDTILVRHEGADQVRFHGVFGTRLVPMTDAPGIAAVRATSPVAALADTTPGGLGGWLATRLDPARLQKLSESGLLANSLRQAPPRTGLVAPESLRSGRAVQAGGPALAVTVDGVRARRAVERSTFYRHLRDLQIVRL
ncbi:hypothetical protein COCCU_12430 [Corynebacterium occultum]|uniref:Uncharacterized protein n=1 Tax=Corynebacterium occultum TaxID=2675219 RepID=A0A6B8WC00_9CORY|nr:hypothetical protein [Corynebacterium occultum]QGU08386.1 hypothetical protein COCCU_12430 [Corynebacterium occultum]